MLKYFVLASILSISFACNKRRGCSIDGDGINSETFNNYNTKCDSMFSYYYNGNKTTLVSASGKSVQYGFGKDSLKKQTQYNHNRVHGSTLGPDCYDMVYTFTKYIKLYSNSSEFEPIIFSYYDAIDVKSNWTGWPFNFSGGYFDISKNKDTLIHGKKYSYFYTSNLGNWWYGKVNKVGKMVINRDYGILAISIDTVVYERIP